MNYARRAFIHEEVSRVLSDYPGLRAVQESVSASGKRRKRRQVAISLEGHLPTMQGGMVCDIPVLVRLAPDHPRSPPECFVEGRNFGELERVHIPYLSNWQHPYSSLCELLDNLTFSLHSHGKRDTDFSLITLPADTFTIPRPRMAVVPMRSDDVRRGSGDSGFVSDTPDRPARTGQLSYHVYLHVLGNTVLLRQDERMFSVCGMTFV
ncbi:PREDICTED: ubiquitin-conjugating enzyme E2 variant 3-like [Branchiostoma belcheri]|uniref:Ubiquitin-conjugating enzyme E2 variant 3-like n=1 Tax=Branchiostoma belcheri TaxID=7741 RepID=A0A6P4YC35_BRABE|nr:PREDICTED: ubiquitin-conjugating enzyme E2 variant 3-like [Branchiostoma belcheri]